MDPRRVLTFRTVARARSFSKAARELHLSQPSVSQQVALLEAEVGYRLFDRGRGGLRPTRAGEVLLVHADDAARALQLAQAQLADLGRERRDLLRLGAFPTSLSGLVPAAIAHLRGLHPDLRVAASEVAGPRLAERLLSGDLDIALGYQDARLEPRAFGGARRLDLLEERFLVALPPEHRLVGERRVALAALAGEDWILPSVDGFLATACRDAGFEPRLVSVTTDQLTMRGLVARGLGVALVPSLLAEAFTGVALLPVDGPIPTRDVFVLLPPGELHPLADDVVHALRTIAGERDALRG